VSHLERSNPKSRIAAFGKLVFFLSVLVLITGAALAQSELTGIVVGSNNAPKRSVSVDLLGASTVYTGTDSSGKFTVNLRPGRYVIRVRDYRQRYEFQEYIDPGKNSRKYVVPW